MTVNHGWIMARRAVILFLPFLSALLFVSFFFCLFLSLLTVESAREKYRGKKKFRSRFPFSTAQCTRQKHPLNIGVYGPRRGKGARELSLHGHFAIYPRSRTLFICLLPSTFPLSSFFLSFSRFFHRVAAFLSIGAECILILPFPLFRSHSLCSRQLGPCGRFSASLARACQFSLLFCLLSRWKHADDKRHPLAKILSAPRKRHSNFNASAMPRYPPLALFRQRCCNGPGTRYSRQQSTVISRFLSNLLTYFAFAAVRARFTSIRSSPSSFRSSSMPAVSLPLVQNLL